MKISRHCSTKSKNIDSIPLKGGQGIRKTKGHLPKGIRAKRACEYSLFLVIRGNGNLDIAKVPIKKALKSSSS